MSQQLDKLEEYIGYHFHNRDHLRRALTCQSAINEWHPQAADQSFQSLEFVGDAALKYAVTTLLYVQQAGRWSEGQLNDRVLPHISNNTLSRIGRAMNLDKYIVKGKSVLDLTDKMLADATEAVLGAIVIDQQEQRNSAENILLDIVARHWNIERTNKTTIYPPLQHDDDRCCCSCCCTWKRCAWFVIICLVLIVLSAMMAIFSGVIHTDL